MDDLLGLNQIPYDSNLQGSQGQCDTDDMKIPARTCPYDAGFAAGKEKKLSEHLHAAVKKRVNIIHS